MEERKNILAELIDEAMKMAYETGAGMVEDEENGTGLAVQACWFECKDNPAMTELQITIFQNNIALVIYTVKNYGNVIIMNISYRMKKRIIIYPIIY